MIVKIITTIAKIITIDMTTVVIVSIRMNQAEIIRIVTTIVEIIIDTITMAKIQTIIMVAHNDRMITSTKGKISWRKKIVIQWV